MSTATLPAVVNNAAHPEAQVPRLVPLRIDDIQTIAAHVARSGLYGLNEAQAFTLMMLAHSRGLHPIAAMERYHVIQGKPAMKADAMLAEFQSHGGVVDWHQFDEEQCSATFAAPGVRNPVTMTWTMEDAKRSDLLRNPMWKKYPRQMLRARVISEAVRMTMPGITIGIYTPEEVGDFEPVPRPAPAPLPVSDPHVPAAPTRKPKDERTAFELVRDGYDGLTRKFQAEFPESPIGTLQVNTFEIERHLVKSLTGKSTEGMRNDGVRKALHDLYQTDRRAVRRELVAYLDAKLAEAIRNYLGTNEELIGDLGQAEDESDPEIDIDAPDPNEAGSGG